MKLKDIAIALLFLTAPVARGETLPVFVPLSQTDLDDPQVGYMHSSVGMEGGTFFFGKKGDPIEKIKKVELDRFLFYEDSKKEVLDQQIDDEINKAEKEIEVLRVSAPDKINKIAIETSSELLEKLIGSGVNSSSISAIVDDLSKRNGDKYYGN